ncbi:MAG: DUF5317 domain-containing protein [Chloroflexota bacterium]|nr:DUF5317 domain-containing protein [Chloroflexota bacterium]
MLYAIPVGLLAGFLLGGRLEGLATLRIAWAPIAVLALLVQVLLFSSPLGGAVGAAGPAIYVASTAAVLAVVVRNARVPGLAIVALGAVSNLAAIVANGGYMPADPGALALAGLDPSRGYSNSIVTNRPLLGPLTDIFALPAGVPMANVFSIGDLLIGLGIACTIAFAMRRRGQPRPGPGPLTEGTSPE